MLDGRYLNKQQDFKVKADAILSMRRDDIYKIVKRRLKKFVAGKVGGSRLDATQVDLDGEDTSTIDLVNLV